MKSLSFLLPIIMLILGCVLINASWPYYIIATGAGTGIGSLAWLTWIQIRDNSNKPFIKFEENED